MRNGGKSLKFCPECGAFCQADTSKKCYVCPKCGWKEPLEETRTIVRNNKDRDKIIVVGQKERKLSTMPKTKINDEIGFMAFFVDTEGNNMAFHSPK